MNGEAKNSKQGLILHPVHSHGATALNQDNYHQIEPSMNQQTTNIPSTFQPHQSSVNS